ncbi:MAG: T9SS type A sorting domain-containing protein [Saprospiraceae bacterium]
MKNRLLLLSVLTLFYWSANSQTIVSIELLENYTQGGLTALLPGVPFLNGVDEYKVVYNTVDVNGNPTIASGAMYIPHSCDNFPMSVYQHGTQFDPEVVPSRGEEPIGLAFAGFGFATIAPDYLGMGDNDINIHPYLHAESQATVATDLLRAARSFIADSLGLMHNDELFITGYSQGGHAAMALHKYIEDNNLLTEFNVIASSPLSGPYDLAGVQTALPPNSVYSVPTYLPYLIESMQYVYGNIYTNTSEVYQEPLATNINNYKNGTMSIDQVGANLPGNVFQFMNPTFLNAYLADTIQPYTHPFRIALSQNANYDWTPQRPVRMVYCTADEQVYPQNALVAEAAMNANGATNVEAFLALDGGTHETCFIPALLNTITWFNIQRTQCQAFPVSTIGLDYSESIQIYPNPTQGFIELNLTELPTTKPLICRVLSISGQVLLEQNLANEMYPQLHLDYPQGMYILMLDNEEVSVKRKVTIF